MSSRDIWFLVVCFWALTGLQFITAFFLDRQLDEFDHLHALIIASVCALGRIMRGSKQ